MRIKPNHLILAAALVISLISVSVLPVVAKNISLIPQTTPAILPALANSAWPMFQHDLRHTGCSPYMGPQAANLKWTFTLQSGYTNAPAIASDGTLYVCASDGGQRLYAVNPNGTEKWSNPTWHSMNSTPAVGSDGTIYAVQSDDLAAYSPNGTHKWSYAVINPVAYIYSSPAIGPDGTVYFTAGNRLFAICDNGTAKWIQTVSGEFVESSPAIATSGPHAGTIYVGTFMWSESDPSMLYAFTEAGGKKWEYDIVSHAYNTAPAIGADGTVYINSGDGRLVAITDTGSAGIDKWTSDFDIGGGNTLSSPAIGPDGIIYIGNNSDPGSKFMAIMDNGSDPILQWMRTDVGYTYASAVIGADSTVYYQNHSGMFYALDGANNGATKWSYNLGTSGNTAAVIDANGCIYVGTMNSKLYCFAPPVPTITSITPTQGAEELCPMTVIITGTNLTGATSVSFGTGITVSGFTANSSTQITATICIDANATPGAHNVSVTSPGGTATLTGGFTVVQQNQAIGTGVPASHSSSFSASTTTAQPVGLPNIVTQSASLSAKSVTPGTPITVTVNIANKSAVNGNKKVTLYVNGQVETTQGVIVNSGGSTKLTFNVSRNEPGDYVVYVDGIPAGNFRVELFRESDGILIFSAALVALAFLVGMFMLWRRQRAT